MIKHSKKKIASFMFVYVKFLSRYKRNNNDVVVNSYRISLLNLDITHDGLTHTAPIVKTLYGLVRSAASRDFNSHEKCLPFFSVII